MFAGCCKAGLIDLDSVWMDLPSIATVRLMIDGHIAFPEGATLCSRQSEAVMITQDTLTEYIRRSMPDATVTMTDRTGTMDHLQVVVVSDAFRGKNLLDRHRMIYQALDAPMKDGRIHALELTARTNDER